MTPASASDAHSVVTAATTGVTVIDHCWEVSSLPVMGGGGGPVCVDCGVTGGGVIGGALTTPPRRLGRAARGRPVSSGSLRKLRSLTNSHDHRVVAVAVAAAEGGPGGGHRDVRAGDGHAPARAAQQGGRPVDVGVLPGGCVLVAAVRAPGRR